jgi:phosphoserine phosphatase
MSQDRLLTLGEEYAESFHLPQLNPHGLELMNRARKEGHRIVWLSDSIHAVIAPIANRLGVDDLFCNRLELRKNKVTGKLTPPLVASYLSGQWANQYATDNQINLSQSSAYGASIQGSVLLSAIGKPCALNPDRAMRNMARDLNWPIVEGA